MPIVNGLFYSGWGDPTTGLASDLLTGKTLNNEDGDNVVGTMPNNGPVGGTITQQAGKVIVPAGYTSGGQVEANIPGLAAGNIKSGANVGGVAGTFTADANAVAGDILTTKTAYVNGAKVTGAMANRGAITQTISTQGGQYTVPAGYHNGSGKVTASFANLVAGNVKNGVNVGGVVGSLEPRLYAEGTGGWSVTGSEYYNVTLGAANVGFSPKVILFKITTASEQVQFLLNGFGFFSNMVLNYYYGSLTVSSEDARYMLTSNTINSSGWSSTSFRRFTWGTPNAGNGQYAYYAFG
ncbi:MAG: hypothetical protein AAGU12_04120 [Clostridiales bacterium]